MYLKANKLSILWYNSPHVNYFNLFLKIGITENKF